MSGRGLIFEPETAQVHGCLPPAQPHFCQPPYPSCTRGAGATAMLQERALLAPVDEICVRQRTTLLLLLLLLLAEASNGVM